MYRAVIKTFRSVGFSVKRNEPQKDITDRCGRPSVRPSVARSGRARCWRNILPYSRIRAQRENDGSTENYYYYDGGGGGGCAN